MLQKQTFEDFLGEMFTGFGEVGGVPIIKDNFEGLFDSWLSTLDSSELIELADSYGQSMYLVGKDEMLKALEQPIFSLQNICQSVGIDKELSKKHDNTR